MQLSVGKSGPGLVLTQGKAGADVDDGPECQLINFGCFLVTLMCGPAYFTQFGKTSGNLRISAEAISFRPLIPTRTKAQKPSVDPLLEIPESGSLVEQTDALSDKEKKPRVVDIAMSDIVGIKKRDKTSLLVVVAAGLEIECSDGTVGAVFPLHPSISADQSSG